MSADAPPSAAVVFTTSDVARFSGGVDPKTVHNWVGKGKLAHFRTPGRHLRFRPADVLVFLERHGYEVPAEVRAACLVALGAVPDLIASTLSMEALAAESAHVGAWRVARAWRIDDGGHAVELVWGDILTQVYLPDPAPPEVARRR